jgi:hypothetical protein
MDILSDITSNATEIKKSISIKANKNVNNYAIFLIQNLQLNMQLSYKFLQFNIKCRLFNTVFNQCSLSVQ